MWFWLDILMWFYIIVIAFIFMYAFTKEGRSVRGSSDIRGYVQSHGSHDSL